MSYSKYVCFAILSTFVLGADQDGSIASVLKAVRSSLLGKQSDPEIAALVKDIQNS